ncbi:valine--tRNA ligase [Vaginisenegalia massiliensis]|uniref:valine--tRNA ligase n=1 Tax=Vaginisenegalia massiliensis TaxID=2058294 RepID=UPI000F5261A1|nr:valine--tRNA ligase [Vaginisenegalia massiliensis]
MKQEQMSTKYQPQAVEAGKYQEWLAKDVFKPSEDPKAEPYSIVIPPPNVTGKLHLGHAWDVTLQDMIIRQKRMQGFDTLWLPGMDHAGIATQAKVEAKLAEQGLSRHDLGREAFVEKVWEWKEEYAQTIRQQWAKMGISVDYSRERFTLDEGLNKAVNKVFVELYNKGLIYRGEYIINWDPKAQTALSDMEVIHKDVQGAFYHLRYPIAGQEGQFVEVATTRPETMLGDTAVAVHPEDERYQHLIGQHVILPLVNREIPIIADEYVDREFGTGVVKITPAHDPNDFEVGNRHDLPRLNVMNLDATMNAKAGKYEGLDRFAARKQIIADLDELGLLVKIEEMTHSVGHSERTGVVVEPYLSTQWFVKMKPLAEKAIHNQTTEDKVTFFPPRFDQTFLTWMENVHDWVISRQLWWGHQIPAWYHKETGEVYVGETEPTDPENWTREQDVLDTWFSSALWPFSTMGWPDQERDLDRYFPTNTLVTGYDIIFFWVSRMIFQSLEFTGRRPFENVLMHGLIRDAQGRKMSKSLGNGIDPMDVIDEYGCDSLRWFLANGSAPGQDVRYSPEKLAAAWNFINKIWNASRYVLMNVGPDFNLDTIEIGDDQTLADQWILARLQTTIEDVTRLFDKFEFGEAGRVLYHFIWDDYCDWYIEMTKESLQDTTKEHRTTKSILVYVLDQFLRLLHPIMPFVTEEIWQQIAGQDSSIVTAAYPQVQAEYQNPTAVAAMEDLMELIRSVRTIRNEMNTPLSKPVDLMIKAQDDATKTLLEANRAYIDRFCNPAELVIELDPSLPEEVVSQTLSFAQIFMPLKGLIKLEDEIQRLEKDLAKLDQEIERIDKKVANENFVKKAPAKVVQEEEAKRQDYLKQQTAVAERLAQMKAMLEAE